MALHEEQPCPCHFCVLATQFLADDPDVVKAARALYEQASLEKIEKKENWPIVMATLELAAMQLENQFHFRLTDDGWEYTDE